MPDCSPETSNAPAQANVPSQIWVLTPRSVLVATLSFTFGICLFFYPALQIFLNCFDPGISGPGIPKLAWKLNKTITPLYGKWAENRVHTGKAKTLDVEDVSGTEWPLYGTVFYLWAQEALQAAWEKDHTVSRTEPKLFAKKTIDASARLIADPGHADWVKKHWGDAYLEKENVFYRMLLIAGLTSHRRLTGSDEFLLLLRTQTDSLAEALDTSKFGILDDYPGECYPTDVISAWACIQRADSVLGTDHSAQIQRALRGFTGKRTSTLGLPAYLAGSRTGQPVDNSRGVSNSNACMLAVELWPDTAREWYLKYTANFWQQDWFTAGFREFPFGDYHPDWTYDIDAGPVLRGLGFGASAFGVAAARRNSRFDHAYPLTMEMIALSWPLPTGRLLLPHLVSNTQDAPYLGEVAILFQLSTTPVLGPIQMHQGSLPGIVPLAIVIFAGLGGIFCYGAWKTIRPSPRKSPRTDSKSANAHPKSDRSIHD